MLTYPHNDNNVRSNKLVPDNGVNLCYYNIMKPSILNNIYLSNENEIQDIDTIYLKEPLNVDGKWYARITNGTINRFISDIATPKIAIYKVPDYNNQVFSVLMDEPYMDINEKAEVIDIDTIKVSNTPLVIDSIIIHINGQIAQPSKVDENTGVIKLKRLISDNDNINVFYTYKENTYIYKGYTYLRSDGNEMFVPLDLNPIYNEENQNDHLYSYIDENELLVTETSFKLLDKIIYLYIKPNVIKPVGLGSDENISINSIFSEVIEVSDINKTISYKDIEVSYPIISSKFNTEIKTKYSNLHIPRYNPSIKRGASWDYISGSVRGIKIYNVKSLSDEPIIVKYLTNNEEGSLLPDIIIPDNVIFHTTSELTLDEIKKTNAMLIGRIFVRPHINKNNIELIDTRTRGGGLKDVSDEIRRAMNIETDYYYDISDAIKGEPIQKNSVIIINVDSSLLEKNGGELTEIEIENAVDKFKTLGVVAIIKYIDQIDHREIL